jgi:hypothetical protein
VCFNNCPVYADAGANAKFTTSLDETHCGVHKSLLSMSPQNLHFSLLNKVIFFSDLRWYQWRGSEVAPMVFMLCGKPLNGGCEPRAIWINDHSPIKQTLLDLTAEKIILLAGETGSKVKTNFSIRWSSHTIIATSRGSLFNLQKVTPSSFSDHYYLFHCKLQLWPKSYFTKLQLEPL